VLRKSCQIFASKYRTILPTEEELATELERNVRLIVDAGGRITVGSKMSKPENNIILYQDENGVTKVSVRFSDQDLWLTEKQIAEIYDTS
jgi:hypothetical protein